MEPIQIIGIDELDDQDRATTNKIVNEYYEKIFRELQNITAIALHVKTRHKGGKQKQYELKAKVTAPTKGLESSETDWDLARTLHKVFKNIERQIEHRFKDSS